MLPAANSVPPRWSGESTQNVSGYALPSISALNWANDSLTLIDSHPGSTRCPPGTQTAQIHCTACTRPSSRNLSRVHAG
jgi:hypothetical protein